MKIWFVSYEGEAEAEGFYNDDGELLDYWHGNDGQWRGEYFDGFLKELGIEVGYAYQDRPELEEKFAKAVEEDF